MSLLNVQNIAIDTTAFVNIPTKGSHKQLLLRTRDGSDFLVSDTSDGASYFTCQGALSIWFEDSYEDSTPCDVYVKGVSSATLEVLMAR